MEHNAGAPVTVRTATSISASVIFGDSGVGGAPVEGHLDLSSANSAPWRSPLSDSAFAAAERVWSARAFPGRLTAQEAVACARAAVDVDMAFFGLAVDWDTARVELSAGSHVVEVTGTVLAQNAPTAPIWRATVRTELVDGKPSAFEFVLSDGHESTVLDTQDVDVPDRSQTRLDTLTAAALAVLDRMLAERGLPPRAFWTLCYSEAPAWEGPAGTCGELSVWTTWVGAHPASAS